MWNLICSEVQQFLRNSLVNGKFPMNYLWVTCQLTLGIHNAFVCLFIHYLRQNTYQNSILFSKYFIKNYCTMNSRLLFFTYIFSRFSAFGFKRWKCFLRHSCSNKLFVLLILSLTLVLNASVNKSASSNYY